MRSYLNRIAAREAEIHAWAWLEPDRALAAARAADAASPGLPLYGRAIGVKDVIDTADMPTAYGSPIYESHRPTWDAACVAALRAAGAIILGKTATTEFERTNATDNAHAAPRYRVNGVVSNMPEFQRAFSCAADAPMVRANACRVW